MKKIPRFKIILSFLFLYFLFSYPFPAWAAILYLDPSQGELFQEDTFLVEIRIDVEEECINAIGAKINFPQDVLEAVDFTQGNSIILLWVEPPVVEQESGLIYFSGVVPGGYCGRLPGDPGLSNLIGRIVFRVKDRPELEPTEEIAKVYFSGDTEVLLNDGLGTVAPLTVRGASFKIFSERAEILRDEWEREIKEDNIPPESFKIEVQKDPTLFDGEYFITFLTDDKQTGVDHYEVREELQGLIKRGGEWVRAESPYWLRNQGLRSNIFVKAVDKAGNERLEILPPKNPLAWYEDMLIWVIIILGVIIIYFIWRFMKKKKPGVSLSSFIILLLIITSLALPAFALAASLYFSPDSGSYKNNQTFAVNVYVSSVDQVMNAASANISFPKDILNVISVSKTGSIFNLYPQEPNFSNITGIVNFEGIVLNPGFKGLNGKLITINFQGKGAGKPSLTFSSASVLANDGKGTQILSNLGSANFTIQPETAKEEEEEYTAPLNTPKAPVISCPSHPDSQEWYSNNDPEFFWELPPNVSGVSLLLNKKPTSDPGAISDGLLTTKNFEDIEDGIWYLHIKFKNQYGWGQITHYKIQIDTTPPEFFEVQVKEGKETNNPEPTLILETEDKTSGIDFYEVKIDKESLIVVKEREFKIPNQPLGRHTMIVRAVDKAGNERLGVTEIDILPIEAPVITDYPEILSPDSILTIKGTSVPEATIHVYFQKDRGDIRLVGETKSDKEGRWSYVEPNPVERGVYEIWVEAVNLLGGKSQPSNKITVPVTHPAFIRIGGLIIDYLSTTITLLVLLLALILGIIWIWGKIKERRRILRKETSEAEKALYQAFEALKEETEEQIARLDGKPGLNEREKKICDELKKALKISEKFIGKEIKDIEKELK
ncbi:MAG TPA: hypothetical protein VMV66_01600 [Candidatus Humimicrobiaceae bacterium]|nr:hypothetical protein [Candidatus Humimicrobiaceae bacterium]